MHDLRYLRSHREEVEKGLAKKHTKVDLDAFYKLEEERLQRLAEVEELKHRRNAASEEIGRLKKAGQDASPLLAEIDRKSTRLNSSHLGISYAVFCLKKKKKTT